MGFPNGLAAKQSACNAGGTGASNSILVREDPLEEEMATHSSILAREIPWTEEPGGLQSVGSKKTKVRHDLATKQQQLMYLIIGSCTFCLPSSNSLFFPTLVTTNLISFSLFVFEV